MTHPTTEARLLEAAGYVPPPSYAWTRSVCERPLRSADVDAIAMKVTVGLSQQGVVLPDADVLVRRCVVALLCGHLVLQGPPGTGKTTLARLLADAFDAHLDAATATADWSTYDVIGGLRPGADGALVPSLGCVSQAALNCAGTVREDDAGQGGAENQATWLLLDELNRADIDKAIGPLYTVLSAVTPQHLLDAPLEFWFGAGDAARLWVPTRFRIVGTMNDVDTSFVNALSQGLARRFQFLYVGVPGPTETAAEVEQALRQARAWLHAQYGASLPVATADNLVTSFDELRQRLVSLVEGLRRPLEVPGWPLGTAQLVDVWRTVLLQAPQGAATGTDPSGLLDAAVADRIVPQMGTLEKEQLDAFQELFDAMTPSMPASSAAIRHLVNPHTPL